MKMIVFGRLRTLCDKLLLSEKLHPRQETFWIETFELIKRIIHLVDYKGVREVLKMCRDKTHLFELEIGLAQLRQFSAIEMLIQHIFDRKNCLLPAYFLANEILKPTPYHWVIMESYGAGLGCFSNSY